MMGSRSAGISVRPLQSPNVAGDVGSKKYLVAAKCVSKNGS